MADPVSEKAKKAAAAKREAIAERREAAAKLVKKDIVAARFGISTRSVDRLVSEGRLPAPIFPLGPKLPLWSVDQLDELITAATVNPAS
jgi:predicted DNA-binding transcriptional regulator AlpA